MKTSFSLIKFWVDSPYKILPSIMSKIPGTKRPGLDTCRSDAETETLVNFRLKPKAKRNRVTSDLQIMRRGVVIFQRHAARLSFWRSLLSRKSAKFLLTCCLRKRPSFGSLNKSKLTVTIIKIEEPFLGMSRYNASALLRKTTKRLLFQELSLVHIWTRKKTSHMFRQNQTHRHWRLVTLPTLERLTQQR